MDDISLLPCQVDCFLRSIDTNVIRYVGITFRSTTTLNAMLLQGDVIVF